MNYIEKFNFHALLHFYNFISIIWKIIIFKLFKSKNIRPLNAMLNVRIFRGQQSSLFLILLIPSVVWCLFYVPLCKCWCHIELWLKCLSMSIASMNNAEHIQATFNFYWEYTRQALCNCGWKSIVCRLHCKQKHPKISRNKSQTV